MASENVIWRDEQNRHLQALITASQNPNDPTLPNLVELVVAHYEKYHIFKTKWAKEDYTLVFLSPPWNTHLEDTLVWIGGWRPTIAFILIYSVSDRQAEARVSDITRNISIRTGDLGDLSADQLGSLDQLQRITLQSERAITDQMVRHSQLGGAGIEVVELSHELSQEGRRRRTCDLDNVEIVLEPEMDGFEVILQKADALRLSTIKSIVRILSPIQAVHFLIGATELQLRVHGWGKVEEESQINNIQDAAANDPITTEAS